MNMYSSHLLCLRPLKFYLRPVDSKSDFYAAILPHQSLCTFGVVLKVLGEGMRHNNRTTFHFIANLTVRDLLPSVADSYNKS